MNSSRCSHRDVISSAAHVYLVINSSAFLLFVLTGYMHLYVLSFYDYSSTCRTWEIVWMKQMECYVTCSMFSSTSPCYATKYLSFSWASCLFLSTNIERVNYENASLQRNVEIQTERAKKAEVRFGQLRVWIQNAKGESVCTYLEMQEHVFHALFSTHSELCKKCLEMHPFIVYTWMHSFGWWKVLGGFAICDCPTKLIAANLIGLQMSFLRMKMKYTLEPLQKIATEAQNAIETLTQQLEQ